MFCYENLDEHINRFLVQKIDVFVSSLLISLEKNQYNGDIFHNYTKNLKQTIINQTKLIKPKKIQIEPGDTLNRHNVYYKLCENFVRQNGLKNEEDIPQEIKDKISKEAYDKSFLQGNEWFENNIDAINELLPNNNKISKNIKLNDKSTILYIGDNNNPEIEFIRYDYWLTHSEYPKIKSALEKLCAEENSLIEKSFQHDINYFYKRYSAKMDIFDKDFFLKQSYKYLFDETISFILKHILNNNLVEFYFGGREIDPTLTFRGKKAQSDPIIQKYLQGPLKGADQRKFVSVKMVEE